MNNLKIGTRIYAGFALMLLIIIGIGGMCLAMVNYFGEQQDRSAKEARNVSDIQEIERDIVGQRGQIFIYLTTGTPEDLKLSNHILEDLERKFQHLSADLSDASLQASLKELQALLTQYVETFHKSVDLREKRDWLVDTGTENSADAVTYGLLPLVKDGFANSRFELLAHLGQAQQAMWAARTTNGRFEISGAKSDADGVKPHMVDFHHALAAALALPDTQPIQPKLTRLSKFGQDYDKQFAALIPIVQDYKALAATALPSQAETFIQKTSKLSAYMRQRLTDIQDDVDHNVQSMRLLVITASVGSVLLGSLIAWRIARGIIHPIVGMTSTMTSLARGDLTVTVPALTNRDEVGDMARAVQVFQDNALENEMLKAVQAGEARSKERRQKEAEELIDMFGSSVSGVFSSLSEASTAMANTADSMRHVVSETNHQIDIVMSAINEAGNNADAVAAASQELTAAINEISRLVNSSSHVAETGAQQARDVLDRVSKLRGASDKIGNIIGIISNIATQTNLLALNATIEAARAGEAGRGFVVVANEVKNLSGQTQRATIDITTQIQEIQGSIGETVTSVDAIGKTIQDIYHSSTEIAAAITEQQSATDEIARNIQYVASGATRIADSMTAVRSSANLTASASQNVNQASSSMASQSDKLSVEVKDFLVAIRDAGNTHDFERLDIDVPAKLRLGNKVINCRARQISAGGAWLDTSVDQPLGSQIEITLEGLAQPVHARIAGLANTGTRLQFPMDSAHLAQMVAALERWSNTAA